MRHIFFHLLTTSSIRMNILKKKIKKNIDQNVIAYSMFNNSSFASVFGLFLVCSICQWNRFAYGVLALYRWINNFFFVSILHCLLIGSEWELSEREREREREKAIHAVFCPFEIRMIEMKYECTFIPVGHEHCLK